MHLTDLVSSVAADASVVQIGTTESLLGIASILIGLGVAWGVLKNSVSSMNRDLAEFKQESKDNHKDVRSEIKDMRADVKEVRRNVSSARDEMGSVRERVSVLENRTNFLYQANSPISLTKDGLQTLKDSGLKEFIDENTDDLIEQCDHEGSMDNPYDIQRVAFAFFDDIDLPAELEDHLKTSAFNQGVSLYMIRRVGGIYFRDVCLKKYGFKAPKK